MLFIPSPASRCPVDRRRLHWANGLSVPLGMALALLLSGCFMIPIPATREAAPMAPFESVIPGETMRTEVIELLGEPMLTSLDGQLVVYAGTQRTGGGWFGGMGPAGGAIRNQDAHLGFIWFEHGGGVAKKEHVVTDAHDGPICASDGSCVAGVFQRRKLEFPQLLSEFEAIPQFAYLLASEAASAPVRQASPDADCLFYAFQRDNLYPRHNVRIIDEDAAATRTLGTLGFLMWRGEPGEHRIRTEPFYQSPDLGHKSHADDRLTILCEPGGVHFLRIKVWTIRKPMLQMFSDAPIDRLEFELHEMSEAKGRAAINKRKLVISK